MRDHRERFARIEPKLFSVEVLLHDILKKIIYIYIYSAYDMWVQACICYEKRDHCYYCYLLVLL